MRRLLRRICTALLAAALIGCQIGNEPGDLPAHDPRVQFITSLGFSPAEARRAAHAMGWMQPLVEGGDMSRDQARRLVVAELAGPSRIVPPGRELPITPLPPPGGAPGWEAGAAPGAEVTPAHWVPPDGSGAYPVYERQGVIAYPCSTRPAGGAHTLVRSNPSYAFYQITAYLDLRGRGVSGEQYRFADGSLGHNTFPYAYFGAYTTTASADAGLVYRRSGGWRAFAYGSRQHWYESPITLGAPDRLYLILTMRTDALRLRVIRPHDWAVLDDRTWSFPGYGYRADGRGSAIHREVSLAQHCNNLHDGSYHFASWSQAYLYAVWGYVREGPPYSRELVRLDTKSEQLAVIRWDHVRDHAETVQISNCIAYAQTGRC